MGERMWGMRVKAYPNARQRALIERTFDAARFVWNKCLEWCLFCDEWERRLPSAYAMQRALPALRRTYPWLRSVDSCALQEACVSHVRSWERHRKDGTRPSWRSRSMSRAASYVTHSTNASVRIEDAHHVRLPKLGRVKVRGVHESRMLAQSRLRGACVRRDACGTYWISLSFSLEGKRLAAPPAVFCDEALVVVDVRGGAATSVTGDAPFPRPCTRLEQRRRLCLRRLSRRLLGSGRWERARRTLAAIEIALARRRAQWCHEVTTSVVDEASSLSLAVLGASSRRRLGGIADGAVFEFSRQLAYKTAWHGRELTRVEAPCPVCVSCGRHPRKVDEGTWTCPACGTPQTRAASCAANRDS
jgi:putative transposase